MILKISSLNTPFNVGNAPSMCPASTCPPPSQVNSGTLNPAWFDVWGQRHSTVDYKRPAEQLDWMLGQGVSVSMYMFHGGTNFWYMNGANTAGGYRPQPTSYDYDAPLGEWGNCYPKYYAFREVIQKHLPHGTVLPEVPADNPTTTFATIELKESAPLQAAFHQTTRITA